MKNKIINILILCYLLISHNSLYSQNNSQITVTGNRIETSSDETIADVTIISRDEIEAIQPTSINDLLLTVSGFDLVTQGSDGQASSLFVRGAGSDQNLILVNGVRVGSATTGVKALENISVHHIQRIEIIKGPRASIWGSDAIGAVINIITRRYIENQQTMTLSKGSNGYLAGSYSLGFGSEKLSNSVTVSSVKSDGFDIVNDNEVDRDGYRRDTLSFVGNYQLSDTLNLDWSFLFNEGNSEFDSTFGGNESDNRDQLLSVKYSYNDGPWNSSLTYGYSSDKLDSYGNGIVRGLGDLFETERHHMAGIIGYEYNESISTIFGLEKYLDQVGTRGFYQLNDPKQNNIGAFILSRYAGSRFSLETSYRHDEFTTKLNEAQVESDSTFNIVARYQLSNSMFAALGRGKGFKFPNVNDLFFPSFGNDQLEPEISYSNELTFGYSNEIFSAQIIGYETNFKELISFAFINGNFSPFNIGIAESKGYDLDIRLETGKLSHQFNFSQLEAAEIDYRISDSGNLIEVRSPLIRRVRNSASYQVTYAGEKLSLTTQLIYRSRRPDENFNVFPSEPVFLERYLQHNISATYQVNEKLSVSARIRDAFDKRPINVFSYNAPGRESFITATFQL